MYLSDLIAPCLYAFFFVLHKQYNLLLLGYVMGSKFSNKDAVSSLNAPN